MHRQKLMRKAPKIFRKARMCECNFLEMGNRKNCTYAQLFFPPTSNLYHSYFIAINQHRFNRMKIAKLFLHGVFDDDDFDESNYTARNDLYRLLPPTQLERSPRFRHIRRNNLWEEHVVMCRHTGEFTGKYHITEVTFNKLVDLRAPILYVQRPRGIMWVGSYGKHRDPSTPGRLTGAKLMRPAGTWVGMRNIVTHHLQHHTCTFLVRPPCAIFVHNNKEIEKQQIG
jgi:hypothetical protein